MKIELSSIIENQFPTYVREEYPLAIEFLKQYYISNNGNKIVQNLEEYLDLDTFFNLNDETVLSAPVDIIDDVIIVESTVGFPDSYGLLKINDEIITYTSKTQTTFEGCVRGFSGIDSIKHNELNFSESTAATHNTGATVDNLSILFLKIFFLKIKQKIAPGFDNREFFSGINQSNFLKRINDFYSSKGTVESFRILFGALFGEDVKLILPRDYLFAASDADYRIVKKLVVESLEGNPFELINSSIYQDTDGFVPEARGTVTYVEKIIRNNKEYYSVSLDFGYDRDIDVSGTLKSDFIIHPKTLTTNYAAPESSFIDVDSTAGFPDSGKLLVKINDNEELIVNYTFKTFNQFLGCSGVTKEVNATSSVRYDTFVYGFSPNQEIIKLRITGVLADIDFIDENYLYKPGENINIQTIGTPSNDLNLNSWKFNIPLVYDITSFVLIDTVNFIYNITTIDDHIFSVGDEISLIHPSGQKIIGQVTNILNTKNLTVDLQNGLSTDINYKIRKEVAKVNFLGRPELSVYSSNIQNTFIDYDKNAYILSPSLPSYLNSELNPDTGKIDISVIFDEDEITINNHQFYTGDSIVYKPIQPDSPISEGVYYTKRVDSNRIKLSTSRENIYKNVFLSFPGESLVGTLERFEFTDSELNSKEIIPQNLIRKLSSPIQTENKHSTIPGAVGIFNNGVEILNYKSSQQIFYGPIEEIIVSANGENYDVVNPPNILISHPTGENAVAYPVVSGGLKRIDLVDVGFDYLDEPQILIKGGSGSGAIAKANLISVEHSEEFNGITNVNVSTNIIGFSTYHKFRNSEQVIYKSNNQSSIGGLTNNEKYFVRAKTENTISLHATFNDSILGINSINITSTSSGIHQLKAVEKKKVISSISIINPGENYTNRKNYIVGINTTNNIINVKNHSFNDGEIVFYTTQGSISTGLTNNTEYYVKVIDKDNVRLSNINSGAFPDYFYKVNEFVNISGFSSSSQFLSYPPIQVEVKGRIGVATFSNEDYNAQIIPVVRGKIIGATLENGGKNYGSEEIIDYNNQPTFNLSRGSGAKLLPIISNGKIKEVIVLSPGDNYISYPDVVITGDGFNAILVPIIVNNKLQKIKIISEGFNYTPEKTFIQILPSGQGVKFEARIKSWRVNLFEKFNSFRYFKDDDGIIFNANKVNNGLQYYHIFASRDLRSSTYTKKLSNGNIIFEPDLDLESGKEINSTNHSPILGWAYDGNPIYGPYGYSNKFGASSIKQLSSSYNLKPTDKLIEENRPSNSIYPLGFFIEDYEFNNNSDLDVHNGRYCATPEFPNGVYAYFTTFEPEISQNGENFENYKKPKFPYVIGESFYSEPISFNFSPSSNQSDLDLNSLGLIRNTTPYNLNSKNTFYESIIFPSKFKKEIINVETVEKNKIDSVISIVDGQNYKVNDKVVIENDNSAVISFIKGKEINQASLNTTFIENIELLTKNNILIGLTSEPHNLEDDTFINFSTYNNKQFNQNVKIKTNTLVLSVDVPLATTTGIVTYFSVYGDLTEDTIRSNDVYTLNDEKIKILNVEPINSRIKVLRSFDNTLGIATHQAGSLIIENSKRLILENDLNLSSERINTEIYFNPKESVAVGLSHGIGIKSTLYFSNPGIGVTFLILPTRYLYLPNHNLRLNDVIVYNSYGHGNISVSTNGITTAILSGINTIFVFPFDQNNIGISSGLIGIGSTGSIINTYDNTSLLYFDSAGIGTYHSFTTKFNPIKADLVEKEFIVSTIENHGLLINDEINLNHLSGITTVVKFKYNDTLKRIVSKEAVINGIDLENNIIKFTNHNFKNGEKVVYLNAGQNISGLQNNSIYYVIKINNYKIKLAAIYGTDFEPIELNLQSLGDGSIYSINPEIEIVRNSNVEFDLSDVSLGYTKNSQVFPSFQFEIFYNKNFTNQYFNNQDQPTERITQTGVMGDGVSAKAILEVTDSTPQKLYYSFSPINILDNPITRIEKINDFDQINYNNITFIASKITDTYKIKSVTNNIFKLITDKINLNQEIFPEDSISYETSSLNVSGGISKIKITKNNSNNKVLPEILNIESETGQGAILITSSERIGKINSIFLNDIGFEYASDLSLKPKLNLPKIIKIQPLFSIKNINVINSGTNYFLKPDLLLIDNATKEVNRDVIFEFIPNKKILNIIRNTEKIEGTTPYIIPINNSAGITINEIIFNEVTKNVVVILDQQFSDISEFPFENGDKVLIENVVVGEEEKGYNSDLYNYSLFEIDNVDPKIGGIGASFTYSMQDFLSPDEVLGTYNKDFISGVVTPEKFFPVFEINLQRDQFILGENIFNDVGIVGVVEDENFSNNYIKVLSNDNAINKDDVLVGQSSKVSVIVTDIIEFDAYLEVKSSSIIKEGWAKETGFFNNNQQRLHDNEYYQNFSYSLMSEVNFSEWGEAVSNLNHPSGFKKFSDLIVYSETIGISTEVDSEVDSVNIIESDINLNCINNFDLVKENSFIFNDKLSSNEIYFASNNNLQDYIEAKGNRVLSLDKTVLNFSNENELNDFITIESKPIDSYYYKKYFVSILNKWYPENSSIIIITSLHNGETSLVNQYSDLSSGISLGYFNSDFNGNNFELQFFPEDYEYSSYYISHLSYNVGNEHLGVSTVLFGDVARIQYNGITTSSGIGTTTILELPSTISGAKLLVGLKANNNQICDFFELSLLNNTNTIYFNDYGNLSLPNSGVGTYDVYYDSNKIIVDFIPGEDFGDYNINVISNLIYDTSFSGVGSTSIENNYIFSSEVITNSGITTEIFRYPNENSSSYSIIYAENAVDSFISEFVIVYNPILNQVNHLEFGDVATDTNLGIITSYVENEEIVTYFIPKDNSEYKIRAINNIVGTFQNNKKVSINTSFEINSDFNFYEAALFGTKKEVEILHQGNPVFKRNFDGSSSEVININNNTIKLPDHYFVTGEEVEYSFEGEPISIASTLIGIAVTDKLPKSLFIVRVNDFDVKVSAAASLALLPNPEILNLDSVGVGTLHTFSSKLQNNRSIVLVDNLVQTPLGLTTISTTLSKDINFYDSKILLNQINNIKSNDLLKINDEIMKVISVGIGSTNICFVDRGKLGTNIAKHKETDQVDKIICNYNIIDNKINFEAKPFVSNVEDEYNYEYTFTGRIFLRSGELNGSNPTYYDNYVFDDISPQFNGLNKSFTLKENNNNVLDISQDNIFLTINNIFQTPQTNYGLQEVGGETTLNFVGEEVGSQYDVNTATVPRGGIIVSIGATQGFGYQPLVSAGGTAIVSMAGTIQSISIGNSGSGYRSGIQTVNVGIQTENVFNAKIEFIGTATVSDGHVTGVSVNNPGIGFTNYPIKYTTFTSNEIAIGATIIPIEQISGITTNTIVSIGIAITNSPVVGVGSTAIIIDSSFVSSDVISINTPVLIKEFFPPIVVFDSPLSYSNLPLKYLEGNSGLGTEATISIVVGQGSSVIDFEINNFGYGYNLNDELTIEIGESVGIPTDITKPFVPFAIKVSDIFNDKISGIRLGEIQLFDPFDNFFNGTRTTFQLKISNVATSIIKTSGSNFDLANNLLIFINDILQTPGESYIFDKGSIVTFLEPPQKGDKSKIFLYKGTRNVDTEFIDVVEEIEDGDSVTINSDQIDLQQELRTVFEISSSDSLKTYLYSSTGISEDNELLRPIEICRLTEDVIINGKIISKDRVYYEAVINPTTVLISPVSLTSTEIFVENIRAFFDNKNEYLITEPQNKNVKIISTGSSVSYEEVESVIYDGDYGFISGIKTTGIGIGSTGIVFQLYIPQNSVLRADNYVVNGLSGITTGYYFKVNNSNVGDSIISLADDETVIGIGTTFVDNIYRAHSVSVAQTSVMGVGVTDVIEVTAKVDRYVTGVGISGYYGDYSWGRIHSFVRKIPKEFEINPSGFSTAPIVQRIQPVKYENYLT